MSSAWPGTPPTKVTGATLAASEANQWSDSINWLRSSAGRVKVRMSAGQSVANNAVAQITAWDTETYDIGSMWTSGSASRITIPTNAPGRYLLTVQLTVDGGTAAGGSAVYLAKNTTSVTSFTPSTSAVIGSSAFGTATLGVSSHVITVIHSCIAGDFFTVHAYQNSGGARTFGGSSEGAACFTAQWIGN